MLPFPRWLFTNMQCVRQVTNLIVEVSKVSKTTSAIPESTILFTYRRTLKHEYIHIKHSQFYGDVGE